MKVLNLYAGIGGNRSLWKDCDVTSVEINKQLREIYMDRFPEDLIFRWDAMSYLKKYYKLYDFIWASPPCQTHSSFRQNLCVRYRGAKPEYPDMSLYQIVLFLQYNFEGKWVVENVKPYYDPLIKPTCILGRHYFWSNFEIKEIDVEKSNVRGEQIKDLQKRHDIDLSKYRIKDKRQVLRNCVDREIGLHILDSALRVLGQTK